MGKGENLHFLFLQLIVWCLTPFSKVFHLFHSGQCTFPCFPWVFLTSTPHNILSKPLAAFPHYHCRNNGQQLERNESCHDDYHQSSERILAKPGIEPATSCSEVQNATDWAMGPAFFSNYVFCPILDTLKHLSEIYFVFCKCFQFGHVQNYIVW